MVEVVVSSLTLDAISKKVISVFASSLYARTDLMRTFDL